MPRSSHQSLKQVRVLRTLRSTDSIVDFTVATIVSGSVLVSGSTVEVVETGERHQPSPSIVGELRDGLGRWCS